MKTKAHCIVAVSGGVDSLVLLHRTAAHQARAGIARAGIARAGIEIHPVYVDHKQRGARATNQDWGCVRTLSRALGLKPLRVRLKLERGASEAELRCARYGALKTVSVKFKNAPVLTAHHADDQLETYFLKLLRGTHHQSIRGIAEDATIDGLRVLRPLLHASKKEILDYARAHGIQWHEDATNQDPRFARNRVRRELLPLLESLRPKSKEKILRFFEDLEQARSATPPASAQKNKLPQGIAAKKLDFLNLKAILDPLLGVQGQRTTRAHWETARRILESRHATKTGGGPRKLVQFPGGGRLVFDGPLVRWEGPA